MDAKLQQSDAPERYEDGRAMRFVGLSEHYTHATRHRIPEQWARFATIMDTVDGRIGREAFGVVCADGDTFDYMTAVHVSADSAAAEGLAHLHVPARHYAVFAHRGHVSAIGVTMQAIWRDWFPASGFEGDGPPQVVEVYGESFCPESGDGGFEIWLAIKE